MKRLDQILPASPAQTSKLDPATPLAGITADSRAVGTGSLFFAVRGKAGDGHGFVEQALASGAAGVVVDRPEIFKQISRAVLVPSTRVALAEGAHRWYGSPSEKLKIVGVTGTNGKTTTTFLLHQLWSQMHLPAGLLGTVQNQIGDRIIEATLTTPDPISFHAMLGEMAAAHLKHAAVEVTSIALDQARVGGTKFACGVFTNLTQDHLDYHGTFENYYQAKKKFFEDYEMAEAILNIDDEWGRRLHGELRLPRRTYSLLGPADFQVKRAHFGRDGVVATLGTPEGDFPFKSAMMGGHNLANSLAALAASVSLGYGVQETLTHLAKCAGAPGRLERVAAATDRPAIFVDYAHTPDALENVLVALAKVREGKKGKIVCVFGCGGDRDRTKRPLMASIAARLADICVVTSDNPRTEDPERIVDEITAGLPAQGKSWHREVDRRRAIHLALELASPEDYVLVAGKGHETYQIIGKEKLPFDDRIVIREYYSL